MARKPRAASAASIHDTSAPGAPAPAGDSTRSDEFQAAVAAAIREALPALRDQILRNLSDARGEAPAAAISGDKSFAEGLAMAIAQLGDQGVGRKHVDPATLRARAEARALLTQLLVEAHARGERPRYQLRNKVYLDEVLVDPVWVGPDHVQRPTEIEWTGVPNEAMRPIGEVAERIFAAFAESIGTTIAQDPERQIKVTAGGLVVHGRPVPPAPNARPAGGTGVSGEGGLRISHLEKPGQYKDINVLGTIAQPARQTA